jgi:uncharacterized protein (TIGR02300 family)
VSKGISPAPTSGLGTKYACYACGAKFYDLNRPEPLCPKCGADQREAPKQTPRSRSAAREPDAEARRDARRMAPLLEEEEEIVVVEPAEPEIGLGLGVIDEPDEEVIDEDEADTPRRPEED